MKKKFNSLLTIVALLVVFAAGTVNAQEIGEAEKSEKSIVTMEEAQKNVEKLDEDRKFTFRGQKNIEALVPSLTAKYFNDLAGMFDEKDDSKEIETIINNAKEFEEKEKVKVVIITVASFSGVDPVKYAGAIYDVNELGDSIVIVASKEEAGYFAIQDGSSCWLSEFEDKSSKAFETFSKNKTAKNLLKLQKTIIEVYTDMYLKESKLVIDNEEIFSADEIKALEKISTDYKAESGIGICILTVTENETLAEDIYDQYSQEDTWVFIVLSTKEKDLDVLWKKEAEEYFTMHIVKNMCESIQQDLKESKYKKAVSSLQDSLIKHLNLYGANVENNTGLKRVTLNF